MADKPVVGPGSPSFGPCKGLTGLGIREKRKAFEKERPALGQAGVTQRAIKMRGNCVHQQEINGVPASSWDRSWIGEAGVG